MRASKWDLTVRLVLILVTALLLAVTLYYGVVFQGPLPDHPMLRGKNDLFLHFSVFLALTIPVRLLWARWFSLASLAFCAVSIEFIQIFQPRRHAAFDDLTASLLGVVVGAALVVFSRRSIHRISEK